MKNNIIYYPYKNQSWALFFTIPVGILSFVGVGYCLTFSAIGAIFLSGLGIVCILLTKVLYKSSQKAILFSKDGLQIIGDSHIDCCYIPWEKIPYAYYTKNYKKHSFLLLSPHELSTKAAKRYANKGANLSRIYIDCIVVIYLDRLQDLMQIKKLISNGTMQVNTY